MSDHKTVGDFIDALSAFPKEWPVKVSTQAGGGIAIEHREIKGHACVAIFGSNGGRFGENPLTEEEYQKRSKEFLREVESGKKYTSVHGDHRLYDPSLGSQGTCYGTHYDHRIIERMQKERLLQSIEALIDAKLKAALEPKPLTDYEAENAQRIAARHRAYSLAKGQQGQS